MAKSLGTIQGTGQTGFMSNTHQLLAELHDHYVDAVNTALSQDDDVRARQLADEFDVEVLETIRRQLAAA